MWQQKSYEWKGSRIHYLEAGKGSGILLLHGGAADSAGRSWKRAPEYLPGFHLLAPDLPGFGQSELAGKTLDALFLRDFVLDFLEAVKAERGSVIGFSMGGLVAAHLALADPSRFKKLVLVAAAGLAPGIPFRPLSDLVRIFPALHRFLYWVAGRNLHLMKFGMRRLVHDPRKLPADFIWETRELLRRPHAGLAWRLFLQSELAGDHFRNQVSERLGQLHVPALLVHGRYDQLVDVEHSRQAREKIPDAQLLILEKSGHWLHQESPEAFYSAARAFLA